MPAEISAFNPGVEEQDFSREREREREILRQRSKLKVRRRQKGGVL
jgi:hypothetical protein